MSRASGFAITLLVAGAFACAAQAAVVTLNQGLAFTAASQSFWGPPGHRFSFSGLAGQSLSTQIGAKIDVTAHALGGDVCVLCYNYSLDGTLATGPTLDRQTTSAEVLTFASPGVGVNIAAASVKAGVDLKIQENLKFTPQAVSGVLQATSRSGTLVRQQVYFDADGTEVGVSFKLPERGDWAFDFVDMELVNLFDNDFVLGIDPFALDFSGSDLSAFNVRVTPEPSTLALLSLALGIGAVRRRARA